jgi:hypothetical protein
MAGRILATSAGFPGRSNKTQSRDTPKRPTCLLRTIGLFSRPYLLRTYGLKQGKPAEDMWLPARHTCWEFGFFQKVKPVEDIWLPTRRPIRKWVVS